MTTQRTLTVTTLFLASLTLTANITQLDSGKGVNVPFTFKNYLKTTNVYSLSTLLVGFTAADQRKTGANTTVHFRSYGDNIIIGDKTAGTWGIDCNKDDGCTAATEKKFCPAPYDKNNCQDASALVRFQTQLLQDGKDYGELDFKIISNPVSGTWNLEGGVFELGPKSPYWAFVTQTYQKPEGSDFIETSFYFHSDNGVTVDAGKAKLEKSKYIFNGRFGSTDPAVYNFSRVDGHETMSAFAFPQVQLVNNGTSLGRNDLCILSDHNVFLWLSNDLYTKITTKVADQLCGQTDITKCQNTAIDLTKVSPITLGFSTGGKSQQNLFTVDYEAADFIAVGANNKTFEYLIRNIDNFNAANDNPSLYTNYQQLCSNTAMAAGRVALYKTEFVVRKYDDAIVVGINETIPKDNKIYLMILVVLAIFILAVIIAIAFLKTCKRQPGRKTNATEEDYERADN